MRRLRIALALLLIALAVPVVLLVVRALRSAAIEERVRHEAVAERIFDEMERTLSDFLAREEARTPDEYRFYLGADPAAPRIRSPLSRPALEPFVIAHFEVGPDGRLRTPLRPSDAAAAEHAGDWPGPPPRQAAVRRAVTALEEIVAPFWRDAEVRARALAAAGAARSAPRRQTDESVHGDAGAAGRAAPATTADSAEPASAYEVLQSLNLGARKRADRREQVAEMPASRAVAEAEREDALARREGPSVAPSAPGRLEERALLARPAPKQRPATPRASADADVRVRVVLEPMAGVPLDERHWMLFRTVLVAGEGLRQGLLLDRQRLGDWLAEQVIGDGPLAGTAVVSFGPEASEMPGHGGHLAHHRFAEPFAGLAATLRVGPLQASRSATILLLLAGALAVVAVLGVLAIHRMASVVVEFAERRSNFAAAVSHELKTPLTAIRMYGEMLRDGLVPDGASRDGYYRTITDESERLSRLIDNVLEFSRLENGRRLLATSVGSPGPVVRDVVERLGPHAERSGLALRLALDEPLPAVRFDRDALAQILFNLVDNAVKYAGRAEAAEIVVSGRGLDDGRVVLEVRDFGPGVPREHLGRIFEPFFRAEAELTRSTRGSGIGLSLVRQLAEAMGATVRAENAADGGLRVRVTLARGAA